jgi:hypothetical protein
VKIQVYPLLQMTGLPSFLRLRNTAQQVDAMVSLAIHPFQ